MVTTNQLLLRNQVNIRSKSNKPFDNKELFEEFKKWIEMGDNIILGIDMNRDTLTSQLFLKLKFKEHSLIFISLFILPLATFNQNQNRGPMQAI